MSSKFIPKKSGRFVPISYTWSSKPEKREEYVNPYIDEKHRIESISLEDLTFRDLYEFPFKQAKFGSWVYDKNSNFIFQFNIGGEKMRKEFLEILNGERVDYKKQNIRVSQGEIFINDENGKEHSLVLIRGWGNLTGCGAYNLEEEYACKIQDTLLDFIIEKIKI